MQEPPTLLIGDVAHCIFGDANPVGRNLTNACTTIGTVMVTTTVGLRSAATIARRGTNW